MYRVTTLAASYSVCASLVVGCKRDCRHARGVDKSRPSKRSHAQQGLIPCHRGAQSGNRPRLLAAARRRGACGRRPPGRFPDRRRFAQSQAADHVGTSTLGTQTERRARTDGPRGPSGKPDHPRLDPHPVSKALPASAHAVAQDLSRIPGEPWSSKLARTIGLAAMPSCAGHSTIA